MEKRQKKLGNLKELQKEVALIYQYQLVYMRVKSVEMSGVRKYEKRMESKNC